MSVFITKRDEVAGDQHAERSALTRHSSMEIKYIVSSSRSRGKVSKRRGGSTSSPRPSARL